MLIEGCFNKMVVLTIEYYNHVKDYLHPNLCFFIEDYQKENLITLPPFHGCGHRNRNGTNKTVNCTNGFQCITPTWRDYWKEDVKPKYKSKIGFCYVTRYMTHLFRNRGYEVYNFELQKYEHIAKTPLRHKFKSMQQFENDYLTKSIKCFLSILI